MDSLVLWSQVLNDLIWFQNGNIVLHPCLILCMLSLNFSMLVPFSVNVRYSCVLSIAYSPCGLLCHAWRSDEGSKQVFQYVQLVYHHSCTLLFVLQRFERFHCAEPLREHHERFEYFTEMVGVAFRISPVFLFPLFVLYIGWLPDPSPALCQFNMVWYAAFCHNFDPEFRWSTTWKHGKEKESCLRQCSCRNQELLEK